MESEQLMEKVKDLERQLEEEKRKTEEREQENWEEEHEEEHGENDDEEEVKLDISSMDNSKKMELIMEFVKRKNITLEEESIKKIQELVNDEEFPLKKYINVSKIYQQITKIGFIKKLENGSYIIDIQEKKKTKSKNYFLNKI